MYVLNNRSPIPLIKPNKNNRISVQAEQIELMGGPTISTIAGMYGTTLFGNPDDTNSYAAAVKLSFDGCWTPEKTTEIFERLATISEACRSEEEQVLDNIVELTKQLINVKVSPDKAVESAVEMLLKNYKEKKRNYELDFSNSRRF